MQRVIEPEWSYLSDHRSYWLNIVGRLRANETQQQAMTSLHPLWISLRTGEFPLQVDQSAKARERFVSRTRLNLDAGAQGFSPYRDSLRTPLLIIMGMVLLVIAMAVVNVASLLLVRGAIRVREFAMRFALGATHGQILSQLLAEGLLLGVAGAGLGLMLAPPVLRALITWMAGRAQTSAFSAAIDWRVLLFTSATALIASLIFSVAPALQLWNPRLVDSLKQQTGTGSGGSLRFRRTCVSLQIGFSLLLIAGAVLGLAGIAIAVTIPVSMTATRALRSQLFNVSPTDGGVYAIAIAVIVTVAALAAVIPARRAASVDPGQALRTE
jgi:putative ABC transport system permease protein